jgi:hypothetical protein
MTSSSSIPSSSISWRWYRNDTSRSIVNEGRHVERSGTCWLSLFRQYRDSWQTNLYLRWPILSYSLWEAQAIRL